MLISVLCWFGLFLEAAVLACGKRAHLFSRFPIFFTYLLFVLVQDIARLMALRWYPQLYANLYWTTQFVSLALGSAVLVEIYRLGLREFPGTAKMARNLLGAAFVGIYIKAILTIHPDSPYWISGAFVKLERDLRAVQSLAILILIVLFLWYAIPLGRNLGGIFLGYSLFVSMSVIQLSIVNHYWHKAEPMWAIVQPGVYAATLGFWAFALWAADDISEKSRNKSAAVEYERLANSTGTLLDDARERLGSTVRP